MLGKFWETFGDKLADRLVRSSTPALLFWLGGLLAWVSTRGGAAQLTSLGDWLSRQSTLVQLVVVATALLGAGTSAVVVQRLTPPALRLLEGYWPSWLGPLRAWLVTRVDRRAAAEEADWQRLYPRVAPPAVPSADELAEFARVDGLRRRRPAASNRYMPTRIGNVLRAAESWPMDKYGLGAVVVWPRLWLVLPDGARQELVSARAALDGAVGACIWGLLFCAFGILSLAAVPIGLVVALVAVVWWIPARAEVFGDLIEAAYDLHRTALYRQLRWPLPANPGQERSCGERLTSYLWRGSDEANPAFTPPPP